ncbi:MAG: MBL fold metallo-hydrolase [Campylobacterales bacterium]
MASIKILGAYGAREGSKGTTAFALSESIVIDAGNLFRSLGPDAAKIDHIVLTHSHMEHICDIPFLIDAFFTQRKGPLNIYGLAHTLEQIKKHLLNWDVWPDFTQIPLVDTQQPSVVLHEIEPGRILQIDNIRLKPVPTCHSVPTVGFVIEKEGGTLFYAADTHACPGIWEEVNTNLAIKKMIIECTYPTAMTELAKMTKHMTPTLLREELKQLKRKDVTFYINHLKPEMAASIIYELSDHPLTASMTVLDDGDEITF